MGKKKLKREHKTSKGLRRASRARKQLQRTKMKIKRWQRYAQEGKPTNSKMRHGWDVSGLQKHVSLLESIVKRGSTSK